MHVHICIVLVCILRLHIISLGIAESTSLDAGPLVTIAGSKLSLADSGLGTASAASVTTAEETRSNDVSWEQK